MAVYFVRVALLGFPSAIGHECATVFNFSLDQIPKFFTYAGVDLADEYSGTDFG